MKSRILVAVSIVLAVCIGLGIPLAVSSMQDRAVADRTESLDDSTLGLNVRGSVTLAEKFVLIGISDGTYLAELSEGKYMLADQAAEKAREYAEIIEKFGVPCVKLEANQHSEETPQPMLVVDNSGEFPSIIVWTVTLADENGSMTFTIDDETGTMLALTYYAKDYNGWMNAEPVQPDLAQLKDIADTFASIAGAEINSVASAENIRPYYTDYVFINAAFPDGQVIGGECDSEKASNALLLRVCDKAYSFNHGLYG